MLIKERMSKPVITVTPDMPILDALNLLQEERIRRAPVVRDGKMIGIISDKDLLNASPSDATSLSVWEINYLMSKVQVEEVMTRDVLTISEDTPLEEAARIMADNKVGGLPIMRDDRVVGIITETDLFKILLELMGARETGLRVTVLVPDKLGELAAITEAVADAGGSFLSFGQFSGDDTQTRVVTFKATGIDEATVRERIGPLVEKVIDVRKS